FGYQQWQIVSLESRWKAMEPKVTDLEAAKQQIRKFRPWFDETYRDLRILKIITEAFPEDGSVCSVKNIEIRDEATVTCSGVARDNAAYFAMLNRLSANSNEVTEVKTERLQGQAPAQFTFDMQWEGGKPGGN